MALLVSDAVGLNAPRAGEVISPTKSTFYHGVGASGATMLFGSSNPTDVSQWYMLEADGMASLLGNPDDGWNGVTYAEFCVNAIDAFALLRFYDRIAFDRDVCENEIYDAFESLPRPPWLVKDATDDGCSGAPFGIVAMMALLGIRMVRCRGRSS